MIKNNFDKETYIKYLIYNSVNNFFWIILICFELIEIIVDTFWSHNFTLSFINAIIIVGIFIIQKLLSRLIPKNDAENIEANTNNYRKNILKFRLIEVFASISILAWILVIIFQSILNFNSIIILVIGVNTLESIFTLIFFVIVSVYISSKY